MSYVMMPVPEEIVDRVMATIGEIAFREALSNWDADTLVDFYQQASVPERSIIDQLVEASAGSTRLSRRALATQLGFSEPELDGHVTELNRRASEAGQPWLVMVARSDADDLTPSSETMYLLQKVADIIRDVS